MGIRWNWVPSIFYRAAVGFWKVIKKVISLRKLLRRFRGELLWLLWMKNLEVREA